MPNVRTPSFRQHGDGRYFNKWAGKKHYFGKDLPAARLLHAESLREWALWQEARQQALRLAPQARPLIVDIAERFMNAKQLEGGIDLRRYYAKHLLRFLRLFHSARGNEIRGRNINAVKEFMLQRGYAPKTINHDIGAIKTLMTWAMDQEYIPDINLRAAKKLRLGPPKSRALDFITVYTMIHEAPPPAQAWLAVTYLTAARPTETVRLVNGLGEWVEQDVFRVSKGKTDQQTREPRHLILSPLARLWLLACEPVWSRLDSYSAGVRRVCGNGGPGALRHSAATFLRRGGTSREDIDLYLGHTPSRVSRTYTREGFSHLRATARLLVL